MSSRAPPTPIERAGATPGDSGARRVGVDLRESLGCWRDRIGSGSRSVVAGGRGCCRVGWMKAAGRRSAPRAPWMDGDAERGEGGGDSTAVQAFECVGLS